jgi:hypothetical protein
MQRYISSSKIELRNLINKHVNEGLDSRINHFMRNVISTNWRLHGRSENFKADKIDLK